MLKNYDMVFISPIGTIGINSFNNKISELRFVENLKKTKLKNPLYKELSRQLDLYFKQRLNFFDIPYELIGTKYQIKILKRVSEVRYGSTKSYSDIAVKENTHARPVGNACRNNPIQLIIPCHRVIGKNNIGGFSGEDVKKKWKYDVNQKKFIKNGEAA
jgi:methylated-DNA-[protein]-cysteine S-methyltransferase|tara:strand:- start:214 stop:690 length:477 start_codon:yes stop_codon:yes gene_type:complete